jgi:aminopeptidase 2
VVSYGLWRYRYNPERTSLQSKTMIAYVVGHELAHQWFGNLVTMEWWTHLWLNEGFATWVGWLAGTSLNISRAYGCVA